jgi:acyl carrier protein
MPEGMIHLDIRGEIRAIVTDVARLPHDFAETAHFYKELGVPSMAALELLTRLEERFGIAIPDDDFVEATTFDRLAVLVSRQAGTS